MDLRPLSIALTCAGLLLGGCWDEAPKTGGYPHVPTPYEDGSDDDDEGSVTINGTWINIGESPAFPVYIQQQGQTFQFQNFYNGNGSGSNYVQWFSADRLDSQQGSLNGTTMFWNGTIDEGLGELINTTAGSTRITGDMQLTYENSEETHAVDMVPFNTIKGSATTVYVNYAFTQTLGGTGAYELYRLDYTQPAGQLWFYTDNTADTWIFVLDSEGTVLAENDEYIGGTPGQPVLRNVDSLVSTSVLAGTYFIVVTKYGTAQADITFSVEEASFLTSTN